MLPYSLVTLLLVLGTAHTADQDAPEAMAAWTAAQGENTPAARRVAEFRAAQAGSLPAMEQLLLSGRFQEVGLIDVRRPPFAAWNKRAVIAGRPSAEQIHGVALANWTFRNAFLLRDHGAELMLQARREMQSGVITHPLVAMELAWHLHTYEPKDPAAARTWFDQAQLWHNGDTTGDRWQRFSLAVDLATVAVNNGYADVATTLTERVEQESSGLADPYAIGMAALVRAFLQQSAWSGKPDPLAAFATYKTAAEAFAQADALIMRAHAIDNQAAICFSSARTQPKFRQDAHRLLSDSMAIYENAGATTWRAMALGRRAACAENAGKSADDLRLAMRLLGEAKEDYCQAVMTMRLIELLSNQPEPHQAEVITLTDDLLPRMPALGLGGFIQMVQGWRAAVVESQKSPPGN